MVPTGMTSHVHAFDPREGGAFRISLTYDAPTATGKTTAHTDTFHGRFVRPNSRELTSERRGHERRDGGLKLRARRAEAAPRRERHDLIRVRAARDEPVQELELHPLALRHDVE